MPNLASKEMCTGCSACYSVCPVHCIEMIKDENGFTYPHIPENSQCINCGKCENLCPVLKDNGCADGKLPVAYAAKSSDESMRMESSSGGIFTELAKQIIAEDGVVYGAAYGETFSIKHYCAGNIQQLQMLRGAKYAESELANTFTEIKRRLAEGQKVMFSGTPCQVAGLKAFTDDDINLYTVDFVCHGIPSPKAWTEYVSYRARQDADGKLPVSINLRSKTTGWSRYQYSNVFEYPDAISHSAKSGQSLFMQLFVGDYINRESCENCRFKGYSRVSDITLGDFWGIWDIDSDMDDDKGTSVILIHSEKGNNLWQNIHNRIVSKQVTLEQASAQNPSMLVSSKANPNRTKALQLIAKGNIDECNQFFTQGKPSVSSRIKGKIKRLLGM